MLIVVPRHSPEDLAAWRRLEREDAVRARLPRLGHLARRALDDLAEFAAEPCYVGVSWGKDSVVVAHLAWTLQQEGVVDMRLVHAAPQPHAHPAAVIPNPHVAAVRDAFLARWPMSYRELPIVAVHGPGGEWTAIDGGPDVFEVALGAEGRHVSGVRAEESGRRYRRMLRFGARTERTCAPIGWWTADDVFAYLHAHDLPVHPAYAMSFGGRLDRRRLRVAALGGEPGRGFGRGEWEARYYPRRA